MLNQLVKLGKMHFTFTNVIVATETFAKGFSVMFLVVNLEGVSVWDFHVHLCWGGEMKALCRTFTGLSGF